MTGCYILFSKNLDKFYIGATQEDVETRIRKHNLKEYGNQHYTATTNDWALFIFIPTKDYPRAIRIERKIKAMKSSKYIQNLKNYPEIIEKLVAST